MSLHIIPTTVQDACTYVDQNHRHHPAPPGGLFAVAVADDDAKIRGVAIVGRPVARMLNDGWTVEITRVATDGTKNACSILYAACRRAALALGWRRLVTYTLPEEGGASLRGAGWRVVAERTGGGTWSRKQRPRVDKHPTQQKIRWEAA